MPLGTTDKSRVTQHRHDSLSPAPRSADRISDTMSVAGSNGALLQRAMAIAQSDATTTTNTEHHANRSGDVLSLSALEQAQLIRRGDLSSFELTRFYADRIARLDGQVSAFVELQLDRALYAARKRDRQLRKLTTVPPFHGVPTAIKDMNFVRGMFTRLGSRGFLMFSPVDDKVVRHVRAGGFVILGKTTTSEMGAMPVVETDLHPPTRNPWNLTRTAGGSSGGAGAAVAGGLLPIAPGSDGAGSIRIPSAFNGLFGIMPSRGRVENAYGLPDHNLLYTCGPLARTVGDAAALLDVMSGVTTGRTHWAPPPPRPFAVLAEIAPKPLRVRVVTSTPIGPTDPELAAAVLRVAKVLEALGHHVTEGLMGDGEVAEFLPVWQFSAANGPVQDRKRMQPLTAWLADHGAGFSELQVATIQKKLEKRVLDWFEGADIVLSPTISVQTPQVFGLTRATPAATFDAAAALGYYTAPFNTSGQPAASIPAGFTRDRMPIGVQIVGAPNADATVLAIARQIEIAMPWRGANAFLHAR